RQRTTRWCCSSCAASRTGRSHSIRPSGSVRRERRAHRFSLPPLRRQGRVGEGLRGLARYLRTVAPDPTQPPPNLPLPSQGEGQSPSPFPLPHSRLRPMPFVAATRSLGRAGLFSLSVLRASKPTADFFAELIREIYKIGARSLPIIAVGGAFVGLSVTLLGYRALETYGAANQISALVGLGLYRELAPVLTALLF